MTSNQTLRPVVIAAIFAIEILLLGGCPAAPAGREVVALTDSIAVLTSALRDTTVKLDTARARYYRARELYRQEREVSVHMEQRVLYYAEIIRNRPTSAKYVTAWMRRAMREARDPSIPPVPPDSLR